MKQKILLLMFLFIFVGSINSNLTAQNFSGGDGSEGSPFEIANLNDLKYLSEHSDAWDKHFILTADIDASGTTSWNSSKGFISIVSNTNKFQAYFNGAEYTISGLFIKRSKNYEVGLFGVCENAFINNLRVIDANIIGAQSLGILVEILGKSNVTNCFSSGSATSITQTV